MFSCPGEGQKYVPKVKPRKMEIKTKTCSPLIVCNFDPYPFEFSHVWALEKQRLHRWTKSISHRVKTMGNFREIIIPGWCRILSIRSGMLPPEESIGKWTGAKGEGGFPVLFSLIPTNLGGSFLVKLSLQKSQIKRT